MGELLAQRLHTGLRHRHGYKGSRLDIQTSAENRGPSGIDSDGFNLWALDQVSDTIYGYVIPQ